MANRDTAKLAVLIDADNAQASTCEELLAEVARYGTASIKRAYGDWTTTNLRGWKDVLHKLAIQPIQQFSYTSGKNATDSALIIDAMDLLHAGGVNGFCLVSSDSDFTRLATRIREAGLSVYGFGEKKTPEAFIAACDKFTFVEILREDAESPKEDGATELPKLRPMVLRALEATAREDGWATLSALGSQLTRNHPSFDPRNYKEAKLGELMRKQGYLEMKEVIVGDGAGHVQLHVRRKPAAQAKAA
jgi:uncharacterized LabA/DUF88 family protein